MKKSCVKIILSMILGVMIFNNVYGNTFHWDGSIFNDWNDPRSWREGNIPTSSDDVVFDADSYDCLLDCPTTVNNLTITADYIYQITIPAGCNLYVSGNIDIEVADSWNVWAEKPNITLSGNNNQTLKIINYNDWSLSSLTINKSGGNVTLNSNIKTISFFPSPEISIIKCITLPDESIMCYDIISTCTPPVTGGIYHIANDFAL